MKEKREEKVRSGGLALRLELAGGGGRALVTRPTKGVLDHLSKSKIEFV